MFTGLVEDLGTVVAVESVGDGRRFAVRSAIPLSEVAIGDSIAVDGVCLTAERLSGDSFSVVAGKETLARTTVGEFHPGRRVHLERALRLGDRLGGHLVQGHVDGVGRYARIEEGAESRVLWVELPAELARYVAEKGSLTLDGVSLTVNEVEQSTCRVNIIPHTSAVTRLGSVRTGERVNVEVDVLAKYVERLLQGRLPDSAGLSFETLRRSGFVP